MDIKEIIDQVKTAIDKLDGANNYSDKSTIADANDVLKTLLIQLKVANNGWCTTRGRPEMSILGHPR